MLILAFKGTCVVLDFEKDCFIADATEGRNKPCLVTC